jgi:hypothetical protein
MYYTTASLLSGAGFQDHEETPEATGMSKSDIPRLFFYTYTNTYDNI